MAMRHAVQDAADAADRALAEYVGHWHPILARGLRRVTSAVCAIARSGSAVRTRG